MCEPTTIMLGASLAMGVASAGMQHMQQNANAKMQTQAYKQNASAAQEALVDSYAQTQERQTQEMTAAGDAVANRRRQEMYESASAVAASGESGVSGFSVDALINEISGVASQDVMAIEQNRDWTVGQLSNEMKGQRANATNRKNSMSRGVGANGWATTLKLGQAGANAYAGYKQNQSLQTLIDAKTP